MNETFDQMDGGSDLDRGPDFFLDVWRRRKWLAFAVFAAVSAGALSVALSLPSLYRATARVIVDRQEVSEAFVQPSVTAELETRIQTIDQRVRSQATLGRVITDMNLYPELRKVLPLNAVVDRMRKDLSMNLQGVMQANGRNAPIAFTLSYQGRDPGNAAAVANTVAALYVRENTSIRERQAVRTAAFLQQEVADVKRELSAQERRAGEFAQTYAFELPEQLEVNMAAVDRLTSELQQNGERQLRLLDRRERLEKEIAEAAEKELAEAVLSQATSSGETLAARLSVLRRERAEMRRQYSEKYPDLIRLDAEISALEAQAGTAGADRGAATAQPGARQRGAPQLAEVDEQFAALKQEEARIKRAILAYEVKIQETPVRRRQMEQLSSGNDAARKSYEALLQRYDAARLATNLELGQDLEQFRILDAATPPLRAATPNRLWIAAMGLVAAFALAIVAVVAAEKLDMTFHSSDAVRAFTGVPVLATIRQARTAAVARRRRLQVAVGTLAAVVGLSLIVAGSYYVAAGNEDLVRLMARGDA
jgi:polysaccharide chain length determinant protein (PEP-CTERM system associated)